MLYLSDTALESHGLSVAFLKLHKQAAEGMPHHVSPPMTCEECALPGTGAELPLRHGAGLPGSA